MKIRAEVIGAETHGDTIVVVLQGKGKRDANWRPYSKHTISVAATIKNGRTFHIGRIVHLNVRAE